MWQQTSIQLKARPRGVHLITRELEAGLSGLQRVRVGLCQFFIQHTSASISINENADPSVRSDLENHLNRLAPDDPSLYRHIQEGADDMPAHIKSSLIGASLMVPVTNGRLNLGTWQGIYLCEHRDRGGSRRVVVTLQGEEVQGEKES